MDLMHCFENSPANAAKKPLFISFEAAEWLALLGMVFMNCDLESAAPTSAIQQLEPYSIILQSF